MIAATINALSAVAQVMQEPVYAITSLRSNGLSSGSRSASSGRPLLSYHSSEESRSHHQNSNNHTDLHGCITASSSLDKLLDGAADRDITNQIIHRQDLKSAIPWYILDQAGIKIPTDVNNECAHLLSILKRYLQVE